MNNSYIKKRHPKGFYYALIGLILDNIFHRAQWPDKDRFGRLFDYGVYLTIDTTKDSWVYLPGMLFPIRGKLVYIGRGVLDPSFPLISRPLNHDGDEMARIIDGNPNYCIFLMGWGMTYDESAALEAYWIMKSGLKLTKRGKNWSGDGLINKKQERRWIEKGKSMLKFYGDNTGLTA